MIERTEYIKQLIELKDKNIIKVITGIRRCGKSTLLDQYEEYLLKNNVSEKQIIRINFEEINDIVNQSLANHVFLYNYIKKQIVPDKMNYIILDEIQHVSDFQKAVDALFIKKNVDLYITGSNSYILSSELSTLLSGRYMEIKVQPLSLKEFKNAYPTLSKFELFQKYLLESSFPFTLSLDGNQRNILNYLDSLYNTIIIKDIADRKGLMDTAALKRVVRFISSNIGNLISTKKISDTMTSDGQKISTHTIDSYLTSLKDCYFLYSVPRYDIKGKEYLKTGEKYYISDVTLRNLLIGQKEQDYGHVLENIVYSELLRRGYQVYIGKVGNLEIDFTAIKGNDIEHYQVSWSVMDKNTLARELKPLEQTHDHNSKFLLTMDVLPPISHNGIKQINILDWILA